MITNPKAKRILCFGDSLTWGYVPASSHQRFDANVRWTGVLQEKLGDGFEVIEEALNSRGIENGDPRPEKQGRRALDYIIPCLDSQDPLDYIVVLLGTNELKFEMNQTPQQIRESMRKLLTIIIGRKPQFRDVKPQVILLAPPLVNEDTEYTKNNDKYKLATEKSKALGQEYKSLSEELGIKYRNLSEIVSTGKDGVHIDADSHRIVGEEVAEMIRSGNA